MTDQKIKWWPIFVSKKSLTPRVKVGHWVKPLVTIQTGSRQPRRVLWPRRQQTRRREQRSEVVRVDHPSVCLTTQLVKTRPECAGVAFSSMYCFLSGMVVRGGVRFAPPITKLRLAPLATITARRTQWRHWLTDWPSKFSICPRTHVLSHQLKMTLLGCCTV